MDKLSVELLHHVLSYLEPHQILPIRRVCKVLAAVGQYFMIREFHLAPVQRSFDRLEAVVHHPILSRHLRKIIYEGNQLPQCTSTEDFDELLLGSADIYWSEPTDLPKLPHEGASRKTYRLYHKKCKEVLRQRVSTRTLERAWIFFQSLQFRQWSDKQAIDDNAALRYFISRLPQLEEVELIAGNYDMSTSTWNAHFPGLVAPSRQSTTEMGVKQLKGFLEAASAANKSFLRIRAVELGSLFFNQPFNPFRVALQSLQSLELDVFSSVVENNVVDITNVPGEDRIGEFLLLTRNLKELSLAFSGWCTPVLEYNPDGPILDSTFAACHWHQLERLSLKGASSGKNDLISFLRHHSSTLKHITLGEFTLTRAGLWEEVFWQMRNHLRLSSALFRGCLYSFDVSYELRYHDLKRKERIGWTISRMVLGELEATRDTIYEVLKIGLPPD